MNMFYVTFNAVFVALFNIWGFLCNWMICEAYQLAPRGWMEVVVLSTIVTLVVLYWDGPLRCMDLHIKGITWEI